MNGENKLKNLLLILLGLLIITGCEVESVDNSNIKIIEDNAANDVNAILDDMFSKYELADGYYTDKTTHTKSYLYKCNDYKNDLNYSYIKEDENTNSIHFFQRKDIYHGSVIIFEKTFDIVATANLERLS